MATQKNIIEFVEDYIIHHFRIPKTITTDQRTMFIGQQFSRFLESRQSKLLHSSPYYAQAKEQAEAVNKVIIYLMKRHIEKHSSGARSSPRSENDKPINQKYLKKYYPFTWDGE
uniref:Integrase catalytic domain-containing protein n=1 Tax=Ananas comosus var. bracteatus TaxID=296719 RepID=A0A6V7QBL2_ANACO|nr:unnamed protein product [Ananas comosus var. bracteatus]